MDDILSNLIVLAVLLVIGGGIFYLARKREAERAAALEELARQQGWRLEEVRSPLMRGVRLTGRGWTLEAISSSAGSGAEPAPGSSSVESQTRFFADRPGGTVLLGPYSPGGSIRERLLGAAARLFGGEDLAEVPLQDPELGKKYLLMAQDPAQGEAFLTRAAQKALLAWTGDPPVIRRDGAGLEVLLRGTRLKKPDDLLAFARLGEALLE